MCHLGPQEDATLKKAQEVKELKRKKLQTAIAAVPPSTAQGNRRKEPRALSFQSQGQQSPEETAHGRAVLSETGELRVSEETSEPDTALWGDGARFSSWGLQGRFWFATLQC